MLPLTPNLEMHPPAHGGTGAATQAILYRGGGHKAANSYMALTGRLSAVLRSSKGQVGQAMPGAHGAYQGRSVRRFAVVVSSALANLATTVIVGFRTCRSMPET